MSKSDIVFLTFYDMMCLGVRLLSSIVQLQGLRTHTIFLKDQAFKPIFKKRESYQAYQFRYNGLLWGSCYAASPVTNKEIALLLNLLENLSPRVICVSTRSFALDLCAYLIPIVKKHFPACDIIAGGWGPTLEPEKFLKFADFICFGEGEIPLQRVCDAIKGGVGFRGIPNMMYRDSDGQVQCDQFLRPLTETDMDSFPFPDMAPGNKFLINNNKLMKGDYFENTRVYDIFAARGCPLNCSYCLSSKYSKVYMEKTGHACSKYRVRGIDLFFEELSLAKKNGAKFIRIKDEVFPIHVEWIEEFLIRYPRDINLPFFGYVRPEFHSTKTLKKLKNAGLSMTVAAIQSGSAEIRRLYRRSFSIDKMTRFARTLDSLGISFIYHFIYANPFENEGHLKESLEFTYSLPFAKSFLFKLEPLPGTPLKSKLENENPSGVPEPVSEWYALLMSMSLQSNTLRFLAKFVQAHGLCKHRPFLLIPLFSISLIKETISFIKRKILLGTNSANVKT